jgi:hypothetical protein
MKIVITERVACAAAQDAADQSMSASGRIKWGRDDYIAGCEAYSRLHGVIGDTLKLGENNESDWA